MKPAKKVAIVIPAHAKPHKELDRLSSARAGRRDFEKTIVLANDSPVPDAICDIVQADCCIVDIRPDIQGFATCLRIRLLTPTVPILCFADSPRFQHEMLRLAGVQGALSRDDGAPAMLGALTAAMRNAGTTSNTGAMSDTGTSPPFLSPRASHTAAHRQREALLQVPRAIADTASATVQGRMNTSEVARQFGISAGTVRSRILRLRTIVGVRTSDAALRIWTLWAAGFPEAEPTARASGRSVPGTAPR